MDLTPWAVIILPTGSGKSLFYFLHSAERNMCVLVFCPFVLLCEQVCSSPLREHLRIMKWSEISVANEDDAASTANIVVCPYEIARMNSPMVAFVQKLRDRYRLGNIVVDEAHVLVHDAHYRNFTGFWAFLPHLKQVLSGNVCVVAITATLRPKDEKVLAQKLGIAAGQPQSKAATDFSVFRRSCFRELNVVVQKFRGPVEANPALVGLILDSLQKSLRSCIIVFCMTIQDVEDVGLMLYEWVPETVVNHSKLDQRMMLNLFQRTRVMVTTSCAGAGLDIPGLDHVVIWGGVWSVESLVQIGGRTGRHGPGCLTLLEFPKFLPEDAGDSRSAEIQGLMR